VFHQYCKAVIDLISKSLYKLAARRHPWLPAPDMKTVLNRSADIIDPRTLGGSGYAVGGVLEHWEKQPYDGTQLDIRRVNRFAYRLPKRGEVAEKAA
jgi:hypothetical protein